MFYVTPDNPGQKRTIREIYSRTQATPWACKLDPAWDKSKDIFPGSVMARTTREQVTLFTGATNQTPIGLSALWLAPQYGIDECTATGTNEFAVWLFDAQGFFEILAPAFDTTANWTLLTDGSRQMLTGNANGQLTPAGVNHANVIAELMDVTGTDKILIRGNRLDLATTVTVAGGA
jgi:hypothetical protein